MLPRSGGLARPRLKISGTPRLKRYGRPALVTDRLRSNGCCTEAIGIWASGSQRSLDNGPRTHTSRSDDERCDGGAVAGNPGSLTEEALNFELGAGEVVTDEPDARRRIFLARFHRGEQAIADRRRALQEARCPRRTSIPSEALHGSRQKKHRARREPALSAPARSAPKLLILPELESARLRLSSPSSMLGAKAWRSLWPRRRTCGQAAHESSRRNR